MNALRMTALLILNLSLTTVMAQSVPSEKRQLTLELDEAPGATAYEIEVQPTDRGPENKKYNFTSKTSKFVINLRPGRFIMRTRVSDDRGVFGPWSETTPLSVSPRSPSPLWPENSQTLKQKEHTNLDFRWSEIPGCEKYRLVILDAASSSIVSEQTTTNSHQETRLPPGRTYQWFVQCQVQDDLLSDAQDIHRFQFTYLGAPLAKPEFKDLRIDGVRLQAEQPAEGVHFEFEKEDAKGQMISIQQGDLAAGSQMSYQLEEQTLYRLQAIAQQPLFEKSKPQILYFERRGEEILSYGDSRPSAFLRRRNRPVRWSGFIKTISPAFEGQSSRNTRQTKVEGSEGLGARFGVSRQGKSILSRADINYSRFTVSSLSSEVTIGLLQLNYSALWLRNFGWKRVPIRLQFGAGYDETSEFIGYSDGHFDVHLLRALGPSVGVESAILLSQRDSLVFGFKLTFPSIAVHVPQGKLEKASRANLDLHYFHDFQFFTGIVGIEIQGQDFTYGPEANQFNLSIGGISFGVMY